MARRARKAGSGAKVGLVRADGTLSTHVIVFVVAREAWQTGIAVAAELLHVVESVVVGGVGGNVGKICLDLSVIPEQAIPSFTHIGGINRFRKAFHTGALPRALLVRARRLWRTIGA